jgi:hypothetical protein
MADKLPPGLEKQLEKVIDAHQQAAAQTTTVQASPAASSKTVVQPAKNQPKTTTTQPPQISADKLQTAHQTAQAETLAKTQTPDKQLFAIAGGHLRFHKLGEQYLLTIQPLSWVIVCVLVIATLSTALMMVFSRVFSKRRAKPAQVKRLALFS